VRAYLESRGLREPVAREFRLGLSPGRGLAAKARERGFTSDELKAAGLANARGNDYFPFRLMFPLADARGRILGFQARRLRDDDPLRGKYVNSPESHLFHKSAVLYGLHLARTAIAKQERAVVVEGNTDVIALRQAGFEPVVASMGTALTERQLKELGRLTRRLYLCFDADSAGEDATLRGMEAATSQGFDVRVVTLPRGQDPADAPAGFEERLGSAESYVLYRTRLELERDALAACVAHPELVKLLAELSPDHFDDDLCRRLRGALVDDGEDGPELVSLRAELDARAAREGLDVRTGTELLLRLRERRLRRELAAADFERTTELQASLARVRHAIAELA
jgi:DNA primase